jgi:hypothetical protein
LRAALPLVLAVMAPSAWGIDRIRLQADSIEYEGITAAQVQAQFSLQSAQHNSVDASAARLTLPAQIQAQTGAVSDLKFSCSDPSIREPLLRCPAFSLTARAARLPAISLAGTAEYRDDTGVLSARGKGMKVAGAALAFSLQSEPQGVTARLDLADMEVNDMRPVLASWLALPKDITTSGRATVAVELKSSASALQARADIQLRELAFQNSAFTWIGEKLAMHIKADIDLLPATMPYDMQLESTHGQFLGGPVVLDFDKNPMTLKLKGSLSPAQLLVQEFSSVQKDLATLHGSANVALEPFALRDAKVVAEQLAFPAFYASFLQLPLATTPFNQLLTTGSAHAAARVTNNEPVTMDLFVDALSFRDDKHALRVDGVDTELHWSADVAGTAQPSWLSWKASQGWGIVGNATRLDFIVQGHDFSLLKPARLPFFDGALRVNQLAAQNLGAENMSGTFDASIEPISVAPIAKAAGLPEFSGKLSGRIPGLTYRDKLLSLNGNLEATVFDGRIVASNLRVRDPLSAWPRLLADITARNLDLDLITRTFEFGSITGRLDVDVKGLETFNWSPVAFDLKMATPAGDNSRHRISAKAVQNLSNIGGGGGGVAAALQSGALQFFDKFSYDRIGLSCRLGNDVCQMGGVGKADTGYYIVKGSGLPRIDIIGNADRVDWPRLLSQLETAIANSDSIQIK